MKEIRMHGNINWIHSLASTVDVFTKRFSARKVNSFPHKVPESHRLHHSPLLSYYYHNTTSTQHSWFVYTLFQVTPIISLKFPTHRVLFLPSYRTSLPLHPVSISSQRIPDWLTDCGIQLARLIANPQKSAWLNLVLWPGGGLEPCLLI